MPRGLTERCAEQTLRDVEQNHVHKPNLPLCAPVESTCLVWGAVLAHGVFASVFRRMFWFAVTTFS